MGNNSQIELEVELRAEPELYNTQMELELRSHEMGKERYLKNLEKARERGQESDTSYGSRYVAARMSKVAEALEVLHAKQSEKASRGRPSVESMAGAIVAEAGFRECAFLTLQNIMGHITTSASYTAVAVTIGKAVEEELFLKNLREHDKQLVDRLEELMAKKNAVRHKLDSMIRVSRMAGVERDPWPEEKKLKVGRYLIDVCRSALPSFITVEDIPKPTTKGGTKTVKHIMATETTLKWIEDNIAFMSTVKPVAEPMVVPPVPWKPGMSHGGGYLSAYNPPLRLVKTRDRNYLEELKAAHMPEVLAAVNAAQDTAWRIRPHVLALHDELKRIGRTVEGSKMPAMRDVEVPEKPEWGEAHARLRRAIREYENNPSKAKKPILPADFEEKELEWNKYRKEAAMAYDANVANRGQRVLYHMVMNTAHRFVDFDRIYFPHQLDFRGRLYAVPQLSPQTADWIKGLLEFAEGKKVGTRGIRWVKIHIANLFGVDKVSFDDRVKWVDENTQRLLACAKDPISERFWEEADKPFQAYAACVELQGIMEQGADYVSHMPIDLDGSCSGLQNLGMALRCEVTGAAVNLVPSDKPADIYSKVMDKVVAHMEGVMGDCTSEEEARSKAIAVAKAYYLKEVKGASGQKWPAVLNRISGVAALKNKDERAVKREYTYALAMYHWLKLGVKRGHVKRSVMTFPYGSKEYGFKEQVMEDTIRPLKKQADQMLSSRAIDEVGYKEIFPFENDGFGAAGVMAKLLYKYVRETVLKAAEAMEWMQDIARMVASQGRPVRWTTPLGFPVCQNYRKFKMRTVKTRIFGKALDLSIREDLEDMDIIRAGNAISPNVTHSLDSSHLLKLVAQAVSEGLTSFALIHDSFGTHAADTDVFFRVIREAFMRLYENDVLNNLREEFMAQLPPDIRGEVAPVPCSGNLDVGSILNSLYAFA